MQRQSEVSRRPAGNGDTWRRDERLLFAGGEGLVLILLPPLQIRVLGRAPSPSVPSESQTLGRIGVAGARHPPPALPSVLAPRLGSPGAANTCSVHLGNYHQSGLLYRLIVLNYAPPTHTI